MEEASYGLALGFEMSSFVVTRQPAVTITLLDTAGILDFFGRSRKQNYCLLFPVENKIKFISFDHCSVLNDLLLFSYLPCK